MALLHVEIMLRGGGASNPSAREFLALMEVTAEDGLATYCAEEPWGAAGVTFVKVGLEECEAADMPHEELQSRIHAGLRQAADWLNRRASQVEAARNRGLKPDIFVSGWTDQDQFDLELPSEFLLACGRVGLPISICTND